MRAKGLLIKRSDRLLAYFGGGLFLAIALAAGLLWLREGEAVYVTRILTQIADCL